MKQLHVEAHLAAFPYSPQVQGLFTKWELGLYSIDDERINPIYRLNKNRSRFKGAQQFGSDHSLTMNQVVLSYLFSQRFPTFPVIGCSSVEQLEENLKAAEIYLSQEQVAFLDK